MKGINFRLILVLCFSVLSTIASANDIQVSVNDDSTDNRKTFKLHIWAPDEVPDADATHVEIGDSYYYRYTPSSIVFDTRSLNRHVVFEFADELSERYQFRWITSTEPADVTLAEKTPNKIEVALDDGEAIAEEIYFELWVLDTLSGERFMCDPQIKNEPETVRIN